MFSTKAGLQQALFRASRQVTRPTAKRHYATDYEQRTKETLKTSSRLTWLTTTAAAGAAALYYTTSPSSPPSEATSSSSSPSEAASSSPSTSAVISSSSSSSSNSPDFKPGHRHEAEYASDVPKDVEDRHGNTVAKHSIAAHKNEDKVRTGIFSGKKFDNHELEHTPGKPGGDFEKRK